MSRRVEFSIGDENFRFYNCANDVNVDDPILLPSITTILSKTKSQKDSDFLKSWARKNPDLSKMYTTDGTLLHAYYENINCKRFNLDYNGDGGEINLTELTERQRRLIENFEPLNDRIIDLEKAETFTHFYDGCVGWAGTFDDRCTFELPGGNTVRCILDKKTSENPKKPEYVHDYKLQLLAYIFSENSKDMDNPIWDGIIAIAVNSSEIKNQVFHVDRPELGCLYNEWMERVNLFYRMYRSVMIHAKNQIKSQVA